MSSWRRTFDITPSDDLESVKLKYKKLALQKHPNKGGTTENFQRLSANWELARRYYEQQQHPRMSHPTSHQRSRSRSPPPPPPRPPVSKKQKIILKIFVKLVPFEVPFLSLDDNATVADAFSLVLNKGAEIQDFFDFLGTDVGLHGPRSSWPRMDVSNGFRIIVKITVNKKEYKKILIDPKDTTQLRQALPQISLMMRAFPGKVGTQVFVEIRHENQERSGWYIPNV